MRITLDGTDGLDPGRISEQQAHDLLENKAAAAPEDGQDADMIPAEPAPYPPAPNKTPNAGKEDGKEMEVKTVGTIEKEGSGQT